MAHYNHFTSYGQKINKKYVQADIKATSASNAGGYFFCFVSQACFHNYCAADFSGSIYQKSSIFKEAASPVS